MSPGVGAAADAAVDHHFWRRLIVPLSYFIEKAFQNWTREGAALIDSVFLYTDFTVPVAALRAKLEKMVQGSKLWDRQVVNL